MTLDLHYHHRFPLRRKKVHHIDINAAELVSTDDQGRGEGRGEPFSIWVGGSGTKLVQNGNHRLMEPILFFVFH